MLFSLGLIFPNRFQLADLGRNYLALPAFRKCCERLIVFLRTESARHIDASIVGKDLQRGTIHDAPESNATVNHFQWSFVVTKYELLPICTDH